MYRDYDRDYAGGGLGRRAYGGYMREEEHGGSRENLRGRYYGPTDVGGMYRRDLDYDLDYGRGREYEPGYERSSRDVGFRGGYEREYGSEPYYGREQDYGRGYGRGYGRYEREPEYGREREFGRGREFERDRGRGMWDRARDEVRSWFGGEESERRRPTDEMSRRGEGYGRGFGEERYGREYGEMEYSPRRRSESYGTRTYPSFTYAEFWMVPGPYEGQGPKNYERSPERITEEVSERLWHHGMIDASEIEVSVDNDEVTLKGSVESRRAKRLAEEVAESVPGVRDVHNRLQVKREEDQETSGSSEEQRGRRRSGTQKESSS